MLKRTIKRYEKLNSRFALEHRYITVEKVVRSFEFEQRFDCGGVGIRSVSQSVCSCVASYVVLSLFFKFILEPKTNTGTDFVKESIAMWQSRNRNRKMELARIRIAYSISMCVPDLLGAKREFVSTLAELVQRGDEHEIDVEIATCGRDRGKTCVVS